MGVIGIDASRALVDIRTGTETYSRELLRAMRSLDPDDEIVCYVNRLTGDENALLPGTVVPLSARRFWTVNALPKQMRRSAPDVLFVPAHTIPPVHPRSVVTIHDLGFKDARNGFSRRERATLDAATRWNARSATNVIAVSETTKQKLVEAYGTMPDNVHVVYHGVSDRFGPRSLLETKALRTSISVNSPFALAVATHHPRKNLERLVAGFELAVLSGLEHDLVIAGKSGPASPSLEQHVARSRYASRIHQLGHVETEILPTLYAAADMTMATTMYEGFGMTALESMACGTPVIASQTGALPEVCETAAIYVDPIDIEGIATQMLRLARNTSLRHDYIERGYSRAREFTWERCAAHTLDILRTVRDAT